MTLHPVILSGGSGMRLWPLSRASMPKQLLPLAGEGSLLQEALRRLEGVPDMAAPTLICNADHRFLVAEQLREINIAPRALVLEPSGRNTAPAVTLAALYLLQNDEDALMLVLPSDHVIADVPAFHKAIQRARELAAQGFLVTFGIAPSAPETGYGYIRRGEAIEDGAFRIAEFVEKPARADAEKFLASGEYSWNSGMFVFRARDFLDEVRAHAPEIETHCRESLQEAHVDLDFLRAGESFSLCPSVPIDVAVMEKTARAAVIPVSIGWSDIGSWSALWEFLPHDESGNVRRGEVILHDVRNSFLHAQSRVVAAVGVEDLIIVETPDAVLVAHKDAAQDVKKIVEQLQHEGRSEHQNHRRVMRPWGSYEGVDRGERFQVKRIIVNPGARLSLQKHHHRAEHWIVVRGTAEVTVGDLVKLVTENESAYVPLGHVHRLHNPGTVPLHLIEVQSGSYLGEDDIVRMEDIYGR